MESVLITLFEFIKARMDAPYAITFLRTE